MVIPELSSCSIWEYGLIIDLLFLTLTLNNVDLPKLTTISFYGGLALQGDGQYNRRIKMNGYDSYDNTLIMRSMFQQKVG